VEGRKFALAANRRCLRSATTGNSVVRNGFVEAAFRDNLCVTVHYGRLSRSCDYAIHAAALAEMSLDQFRQYEHDHRPLVRDMGLIR